MAHDKKELFSKLVTTHQPDPSRHTANRKESKSRASIMKMDAEQGGNQEHGHEEQAQGQDDEIAEQQQEPQQPILVVALTDVIMGRGLGPRQHPGNRRYKLTVEMHRARYEAASSRPEKTFIADEIVAIVKQTGRFLKRDPDHNTWVEVDDMQARAKVGQVCYLLKSPVGYKLYKYCANRVHRTLKN
jgi:hypothetical protein